MQNQGMSIFLPDKINSIDDYERFKNTKAYLKQNSGSLVFFEDQKEEIKKLARNVGYNDFNKFIEHRRKWHKLERKIPLAYLDEIGVKRRVLDFVLELDYEQFKEVLDLSLSPDYAIVRLMPSIYKNYQLPENISEDRAVEILKDYAKREEKYCFIKYDFKNIKVTPEGEAKETLFPPDVRFTDEYLIPKNIK